MKFIKRHFLGLIFFVCFISGLVACFATAGVWFWFSVIGACGTGFAALNCFLHPPTPKPFERIYTHVHWTFDPKQERFPTLVIPASVHGMGIRPRLEFRQGDLVFPLVVDADGNITIIRNNHSLGRLKDMGVIIRQELY